MLPSEEKPDQSASNRPTRVYLMRHGQSTFEAAGRFQGCCDEPELTEAGIATAEAAGEYLKGAHVQAVISSPLRRASQTAVRIYSRIWRGLSEGPSFETEPLLREIELPQWQGLGVRAVREQFAEQYRIWREQPHLFRMPEDQQPVKILCMRAECFWRKLLRRFAGKNVLVVTHGGTSRALLSTALRIRQERFHRYQQSNGGITILDFPPNSPQRAHLCAMNVTDYLGEHLPRLKESRTGLRVLLVPTGGSGDSPMRPAAEFLNKVRLDAVLGDSFTNRELACRLLHNTRHAGVQVSVGKVLPDLPIPSASLATVLWVVHDGFWRTALHDVLGMRRNHASRLAPTPFSATVLHYPGPGRPPVLQAVNLHDDARLAPAGQEPCVKTAGKIDDVICRFLLEAKRG
jgi:broad specificity phosphatase PhoE